MALGHIGIARSIANRTSERSEEAIQCNRFYEQARDEVLTAFPWPFATKYTELGLVEEDPNNDWAYAYRYPSDCMYARRLVTVAGRRDGNPPPFRIGQDSQGKLIYTDEADAVLEYTVSVTDEGRFDALFVKALSFLLGHYIAMPLSRVSGERERCYQYFQESVSQSKATSLNEGQQNEPLESEFVRARE